MGGVTGPGLPDKLRPHRSNPAPANARFLSSSHSALVPPPPFQPALPWNPGPYSQTLWRVPMLLTCAGPGPTRRRPVAWRAAAAEGAFGVSAVAVGTTGRGTRTAFVHICGGWGCSERVQSRDTPDQSPWSRVSGGGGGKSHELEAGGGLTKVPGFRGPWLQVLWV